jgi:ATP-dependent exoDNAse (exonuclease V) beta subunit
MVEGRNKVSQLLAGEKKSRADKDAENSRKSAVRTQRPEFSNDGLLTKSADVKWLDDYRPADPPAWARGICEAPLFPEIGYEDGRAEHDLGERWRKALEISSRPIAAPAAVTDLARKTAKKEGAVAKLDQRETGNQAAVKKTPEPDKNDKLLAGAEVAEYASGIGSTGETSDLSGERDSRQAAPRFGREFGLTVHAALSALLRGSPVSVEEIVEAAARTNGLREHLDVAAADVRRALQALDKKGILKEGIHRCADYPVVHPDGQGLLITGFIDLVADTPDAIWVIDFKTDNLPVGPIDDAYPEYLQQIGLYKELLEKSLKITKPVRAALLFTAEGEFFEATNWPGLFIKTR